jgi:hypothetical protein
MAVAVETQTQTATVPLETIYVLSVTSRDSKKQGAWLAARATPDVIAKCLKSPGHVYVTKKFRAQVHTLRLAGEWEKMDEIYKQHIEPVSTGHSFVLALRKSDFALLEKREEEKEKEEEAD